MQQSTNYTCVPASVQTELAMALGSFDTSSAKQLEIYSWGRQHLGFPLPSSEAGLDPHSWSVALGNFSGGRLSYADATYGDGQSALRAAAATMRRTGHPQGLLVYRGGHAWTMVGFTATADPAATSSFSVTGVYVVAPYQAWTDPGPNTYFSASSFVASYLTPYFEPAGTTIWTNKYTVVLG